MKEFAKEFEELCKKHKAKYEITFSHEQTELMAVFSATRDNTELYKNTSVVEIVEDLNFEPVKIKRGRGRPRKEK